MVQTSGGWHTHLAILVERANGRTPTAFWTVFGDIEARVREAYPEAVTTSLGDLLAVLIGSSVKTSRRRALVSRSMQAL